MSSRRLAGLLAPLLLLAGCGGVMPSFDHDYISSSYVAHTYSTSVLMSATTGRNVPVRVSGLPFPGLSQAEFANRVVSAMPAGFLNRAQYMVDPGGIAGIGYRVVWTFDPDPRANVSDVCQGRASSPNRAPATSNRLRAAVALCQGTDAFVANYGAVSVSGPDDPTFAAFIRQMTLATLLAPTPGTGGAQGGSLDMHLGS